MHMFTIVDFKRTAIKGALIALMLLVLAALADRMGQHLADLGWEA